MTHKIDTIKALIANLLQPAIFVRLVTIVWDALTGAAPIQHPLLTGFAGLGKTMVADSILTILSANGWKAHSIAVGTSLAQFKTLLIQNCTCHANKNVLFFDECHVLKKEISNFLKQLLELSGKHKTVKIHDSKGTEYEIELNPNNFMCIFATNETMKDSAIKGGSGRVTDLRLLPYQLEDRAKIFCAMWPVYNPNVKLPSKEAVLTYCRNVRPFARAIKKQIQDVRSQMVVNDLDVFTVEGARKALKANCYFKDGWNSEHLEVLDYLAKDANGRLVSEVASFPMKGADPKEASALLGELRQADFVLTTSTGKKAASSAGVAYLQSLTAKKTVGVEA
jgi:Holliday junction resolvasome RuvABC ATP-dependent DNA helicase subunit